MRRVSTKSERFTFYFTIYIICTTLLITEYKWIEQILYSFQLIYNTTYYHCWLESYKGKPGTTSALVLSILKPMADLEVGGGLLNFLYGTLSLSEITCEQ